MTIRVYTVMTLTINQNVLRATGLSKQSVFEKEPKTFIILQ